MELSFRKIQFNYFCINGTKIVFIFIKNEIKKLKIIGKYYINWFVKLIKNRLFFFGKMKNKIFISPK